MLGPRILLTVVTLLAFAMAGVGMWTEGGEASGKVQSAGQGAGQGAGEGAGSAASSGQSSTAKASPDARSDAIPDIARDLASGTTPEAKEPTPLVAPVSPKPALPFPGDTILPGRMLVAYYGSSGGGALGILGEKSPDKSTERLRKAAAPFATPERPVQIVYELIVTIADAHAGKDKDFNHSISRKAVQTYIDAAHRNGALVVLDIQPGRDHFLDVAKEWEWALKDPWVGLALDPEWRMGKGKVPARAIGSVKYTEINEVTDWLAELTRANNLPQKLFLLHTFKHSIIRGLPQVAAHPELAMVLHVDGFGSPGSKLGTFKAVVKDKPAQMAVGFKLFYDEDTHLMKAANVARIQPQVDFVSYQ